MNEQIEAIRNEIKRLEEIHERNLKKPMERGRIGFAHGVVECCDRILSFIDSLPEVPDKSLEEEAGEYNKQVIEETKCHHNALTYAEGYEDALLLIPDAFIAGAQWQAEQNDKDLSEKIAAAYQLGLANKEEQMMKDAISCNVIWHDGPLLDYTQEQQDNALEKIGATIGDKVRIIIVKED